jgi:hypothetical protein
MHPRPPRRKSSAPSQSPRAPTPDSGWQIARLWHEAKRNPSRAFQEARLKFGERLGALIAGRTLDASAVSDAALALSAEATVSIAVLRSLMRLKEQLEVQQSAENETLLRVLGIIASRQEHLTTLTGELSKGLAAVRSDLQATDDEKFALAEQLLQRYTDEIAQSRIAEPDYRPFFRDELGEACWNWLGADVQRVFNTAEDLYRYQEAKTKSAPLDPADFTPPILGEARRQKPPPLVFTGGLTKPASKLYKVWVEITHRQPS